MPATPFSRILVANRGEVALRIMRTARAMGYGTVAVHSTVDAGARHVRGADMATCIGAASLQASYLNSAAMIDAALRCGADAVHPGWGFLSENGAFAQACLDAGLIFIGPRPETIALMGDKALAKARMAQAGLPCIPGYDGLEQDEARLLPEARRIGFPVMVKARAGGGGRGMRIAAHEDEFAAMLRLARSEAQHAFGDDSVLLERALASPRHVEIQVVADRHGNAIHLGERDCSVQRRHQKLIEESPSPAVPAALRERMGSFAVQAARAVGYEGVGTLEFLLDAQGGFWFMEMNTRLQVEHCVTEAVTGLDLVELQLRIAAGEPLPLAQDAVRSSGHAVQARLCTEDPEDGFVPRSGKVLLWRAPPACRVETALETGGEIAPDYDSLAAKLVAHAATREEALRKLAFALDETVLLGVAANTAFLASCIRHPVFARGGATTSFIEDHKADLLREEGGLRLQAVAALLMLALPSSSFTGKQGMLARLSHRPCVLALEMNGVEKRVVIEVIDASDARVTLDGREAVLTLRQLCEDTVRVICGGIEETVVWARDAQSLWLHLRGRTLHAATARRGAAFRSTGAQIHNGLVAAGMNGRIAQLLVRSGDTVQAGQPLFSIEAMKMEHAYSATVAGRVSALHAEPGQLVRAGELIAEIEQEKIS